MNTGTVLIVGALGAGVWLAWRLGARRLAFGLALLAVLPALTLVELINVPIVLVIGGFAGLLLWHRRARTAATVTRWGARSRRKSGVASTWDILRVSSWWAVRRRATTVRPSLAGLSRRELWRVPTVEVAVRLCRVGLLELWSSIEAVILVFGGPRMGKSAWLAGRIIDAVGAVLVTSTRTDLYEITHRLRARKGPVYIFNAVGLGNLASTITFDPLTGCKNPVTATERAADMIGAGSRGRDQNRAFWEEQASRVLAALLHAAALGENLSMRDVLTWAADPEKAEAQLARLLRQSPEPAYVQDIKQFIHTNPATRTSITSTVMLALRWLSSPTAREAASGHRSFDVAKLLEQRATVYLLGAEEAHSAPLLAALTGHIAREARRIAATRPGGRLDPPLSLILDEAALIAPVPLESWSADMGGRGVLIIAVFQSRAQLLDRYGEAKAAVIINNAGAKVLFGNIGDRDDLNYWSTLAGERDEPVNTTDMYGRVASRSPRKTPVLAPAQLSSLPEFKVVVFRKGMPPAVGKAERAWRRRDVRAQAREQARADNPGPITRLATALAGWRTRRRPAQQPAPGWPRPSRTVHAEVITTTAPPRRDGLPSVVPAGDTTTSTNGGHGAGPAEKGRWN